MINAMKERSKSEVTLQRASVCWKDAVTRTEYIPEQSAEMPKLFIRQSRPNRERPIQRKVC